MNGKRVPFGSANSTIKENQPAIWLLLQMIDE